MEPNDPEILVNISFRLSSMQAMDRTLLAESLGPIFRETLIAGGVFTHFSMQPYDPDSDD